MIAARDTQRANQVAAEARKLNKGEVQVVETDATNRESLENAVQTARRMGDLDVLYNGVGWSVPGSFLDLDPALWDRLYDSNLRTVLLAYKTVLPIMIGQRGGCIITMSSVTGRRPSPLGAVYGAMKCAVIHLAQAIALEVGQYGVRVNVVAPGTDTAARPRFGQCQ